MLLFLAWMDQSLVPDKQIAARKGLVTDFADERFLLCVGANVALEVFLFKNSGSVESPTEAIDPMLMRRDEE